MRYWYIGSDGVKEKQREDILKKREKRDGLKIYLNNRIIYYYQQIYNKLSAIC